MKKLTVWMLVMALTGCMILTSCGGNNDPQETEKQTVTETTPGAAETNPAGTETGEGSGDVTTAGGLYDEKDWTKNY